MHSDKDSPMNNPSVKATWAQVLYFRIFKDFGQETQPARVKVFNNERQQCQVKVAIVVQDAAGNPVELPEADFQKLELIDYGSGQPLPAGWQVSRTPGEYTWDEAIIPDTAEAGSPAARSEHADDDAAGRLLNRREQRQMRQAIFYVSTRSTSRMQIAARIPLPGGGAYATTNTVWISDPDGLGDKNGNFNSSVLVTPTAFPSLPITSYGEFDTSGNLMAHRVGDTSNFFLAEEHYVFVNLNGRELALKSVSASTTAPTGFAVYTHGDAFDTFKWGISYYGQPNASAPEHLPLPPLRWFQLTVASEDRAPEERESRQSNYDPLTMFRNSAGSIVGRSNTRVVIGLILGILQGRFVNINSSVVPDVNATTLHMLDVYGNYHSLNLTFGAKANQLKISRGASD